MNNAADNQAEIEQDLEKEKALVRKSNNNNFLNLDRTRTEKFNEGEECCSRRISKKQKENRTMF